METKAFRNSSNPRGTERNFIRLTCLGLWPVRVSTDDSEMCLHACQNWRMKKLFVYFTCVTLWIKKKPHWQLSLLLQLLKSFDRTQSSQKGHGGGKKKTIESDKTNWALCPEYWQDWIVLQMIAAWSKKTCGKRKVCPSELPFCTCLCLWLTTETNCFIWDQTRTVWKHTRVCGYIVCCSEVRIHMNPWFV